MPHPDRTPETLPPSDLVVVPRLDRRALLLAGVAGVGAALLGRASRALACDDTCEATEDNIEGPYYLAGAPVRSDLVTPGTTGTALEITGTVRSARCAPLAGAVIEVWQADAAGRYDERGFAMRGTLVADQGGRFRLRTIVPGRYLNGSRYRPAHVHVKVRAPGHRALTTQLYFPNDPYNVGDPWIRPSLVLATERDGRGLRATRDLVLAPR